jgi:hypothetical protein
MSLNIGNSIIEPYLKYNARNGEFTIVVDANDARTIVNPTFLANFDGTRVGWLLFREGQAPERVLDPSLTVSGPQPTDNHKRGFVVDVFLKEVGKLEFSSASTLTCIAVREAYDEWEAQRGAHPGLCPVVKCVRVEPKRSKFGTNFQPVLSIVGWGKWPAPNGNGGQPATAPRPLAMPAAPEPPPPASPDEYGFDDDMPF